jgi:hypothetical protein
MQKILFIITKSEIGGAQKFVKEQIDISTKEFDVYLCCNQDGWLSQQSADKLKGHFFSSSIEKKTSLLFLFQLIIKISYNSCLDAEKCFILRQNLNEELHEIGE